MTSSSKFFVRLEDVEPQQKRKLGGERQLPTPYPKAKCKREERYTTVRKKCSRNLLD